MKKQQNEELQSRREFFKKAAKGALPILGAIVLANAPLSSEGALVSSGCNGSCSDICQNSCSGGCYRSCVGSCSRWCKNSCEGHCYGGCYKSSR
ncbi:MAG: Cys-Xaa-Xaa-Xaa repeat radical SAM target protein [Alloprevotella sp.]